mmetsp:Transcript_36938/g.59360  ORF Transcript_36938/g.59360 Transcript_36938/m.59360 type:complete len:259 (-) Transcript_36938:1212-1988(-)
MALAMSTISSSEGVMRPERPQMSALLSMRALMILSLGHITPMSITLKLLQPSTTATMFLPMSWTSPLTVAIRNTPALVASPVPPLAKRSSSIKGMRWPTDFFITRADLITCGKNILPAPKRSPTTFMPSMRGPSMICRGLGYAPPTRHSSVSATQNSSMPLTSACSRRLPTAWLRHALVSTLAGPLAPPAAPFLRRAHGLDLASMVAANSSMRSVALLQRFSSTSSTYPRSSLSIFSYTSSITCAELTMPMSMPASHA